MAFIELTDTSIDKKVLLNTKWIKAVFPIEGGTAVVMGDGYFNPINNNDQPERFLVSESYGEVCNIARDAEFGERHEEKI